MFLHRAQGQFISGRKKNSFSSPNSWRRVSLSSLCNWVLCSAAGCVFSACGGVNLSAESGRSTLQWKESGENGTVTIQKSAYSRKTTRADSSAWASLTCESRAYSLILWQKGPSQQETLVCLAAFHHAALHQPRSLCHSVTAACRVFLLNRLQVSAHWQREHSTSAFYLTEATV